MGRDPDHPPAVVCTGLAKTFEDGTEAVRPVDLTVGAGQTIALVGPSGCGKSTLLRMVAGLEAPSAGRVAIAGRPPAETLRRAGLAVAFQDPSLLPWRTVRGNVRLALRLARRPMDDADIDHLLALVGLAGFEETRPAALSGGMRQRAAIARALSTRPGLLLLDEPFGAVDDLTRRQLARDLPRLWEARGTTTLLVTHSVSEAVRLSDRVIVLSPRPARVVAEIAIGLPRPRTEAIGESAQAAALTRQIFAALSDGMASPATAGPAS
ncbi:ABC transporter ATP-binding protein [Roseospira navarrensis]|uniref:ATP-binding cassette domain-containing protein n=1 Tax=Roseospira navarrensis TaxID=140058 RepID=A0A7X2D2F1_9PROT|nr:ABC transporter ATP-binding protein [Roseospira navarrensis]MQX35708.1 ATP-binding cassette domain-containing protein [Roseospira navarrensis]